MTMRTDDMKEIVRGTLDHLRVRCEHRNVALNEVELQAIGILIEDILSDKVDNSADTGGDYDNS